MILPPEDANQDSELAGEDVDVLSRDEQVFMRHIEVTLPGSFGRERGAGSRKSGPIGRESGAGHHELDLTDRVRRALALTLSPHRTVASRPTCHRLVAAAAILLAAAVLVAVAVLQSRSESEDSNRDEAALSEPDHEPAQDPKQERLRRVEAKKQARRWVKFLEIDNRRAEAANALLKMGAEALPALLQALSDPRPVVAQRVCHILRALGSQAAAAKEQLTALSRSDNPKFAYAARYALAGIRPAGITLVADFNSNKLHRMDTTGKVMSDVFGIKGEGHCDAELLPNGNYLVCSWAERQVAELTAEGKTIWSYNRLKSPFSAERLPEGTTLIADGAGCQVLEVDRNGNVVWRYAEKRLVAFDAERLINGNTLITGRRGSVIEVNRKHEVVWKYEHRQHARDADRLANGNTLIALYKPGTVIEVTPKGKVVFELGGLTRPSDADRLPNGNTLVALAGEVAEYDANGKKIWSMKLVYPGEVNRY